MIQNELLSNIVGEQKPELIKGYPRSENEIQYKLNELSDRISPTNPPEAGFLGIGIDGHIAGIFNVVGTDSIQESFLIHKREDDPYQRVTISMHILEVIPNLVFFVTGHGKKPVLTGVLSSRLKDQLTPISYLLNNGKGGKTIICDRSAAPDQFPLGETFFSQDST